MVNFLQKYEALKKSVPVPAVRVTSNENCQFVDYTHFSKNCRHCFVCVFLENSIYCTAGGKSRDLIDCEYCGWCELCYHCVECIKCYQSTYLQDCTNCRNCHFCSMCINCTNCFGCVALTHKQYCIFNKQYTKEEYEKRVAELRKEKPEKNLRKLKALIKKTPRPQSFQRENTNCPYGDYLTNSKNVYWGFNTYWLENSGYVFFGGLAKNSWDMTFSGGGGGKKIMEGHLELCYQMIGGGGDYLCAYLEHCTNCTNCYYGSNLRNCSDCFGCVGLTNKKYCILNNQLTKEEYKKAVKVIKKELRWEDVAPKARKNKLS